VERIAFEIVEDFIPISRQSEIPLGDEDGFIGAAFLLSLFFNLSSLIFFSLYPLTLFPISSLQHRASSIQHQESRIR
jgi:hypothetical protein